MSSRLLLAACGAAMILAVGMLLSFLPRWHRPLLQLSIITMFFDILSTTIGGVDARPYQAVTVALLIAFCFRAARKDAPACNTWVVVAAALFTLLCWASLLISVNHTDTIQVALGQTYLLALLACVILAQRTGVLTVGDISDALIIGATLSSAAGLLEFVASYGGVHFQTDQVTGIPWHRAAGLLTEPDWGGLTAAMGLLGAYLRRPFASDPRIYGNTVVAVNAAELLIAGARAAWISFIGAVLTIALTRPGVRGQIRRLLPAIVIVVLGIAAYAASHPSALSRLSPDAVLGGSGAGDSGSTHSRLGVIRLIEAGVPGALWLGHGAGTLAAVVDYPINQVVYGGGGQLNAGHGNANIELTLLWDGGIVMLTSFLFLALFWLRCAWRARRHPELFAISVVMLIDFQFNNGIRFAFVWVVVAACAMSARQARARTELVAPTTDPSPLLLSPMLVHNQVRPKPRMM